MAAELALLSPTREPIGTLRIELLPGTDKSALLDLTHDPERDPSLEPIQLRESVEYLYSVDLKGPITIEPKELFWPDHVGGTRGRLRPGLSTGSVTVTIKADGELIGQTAFEVRSSKLDYLTTYRAMLQDLGDWFTELIMERFGPTEQSFRLDQTQEAATLYQRFAFLKSLIGTPEFEAAMQQILAHPHRAWVVEQEERRPGQPIPASSAVLRQLSRPGPRVAWPGGPLPSLPATIQVNRTTETLDTPENRFVRFVLERWQDLLQQIEEGLRGEKSNSTPVVRGLREVEALLTQIQNYRSASLFDQVGRLGQLPANSQVLQKRSGYRDLFRAFIQVETAATLSWDASEDLYKAGQRDVAALYEFWVFYQVARLIADLTGASWEAESLLEARPDGLGIRLKRGRLQVLTGRVDRLGRPLQLKLYFNRTFAGKESWTRPMRPDLSLLIEPEVGGGAPFEPVWVHFDAKYRVESLAKLFGAPDESVVAEEQETENRGQTLRSDLLKMHAYRDAIRRSAGAYVIYPGTEVEKNQPYHEILPGLGAFPLRPSPDGGVEGTERLSRFIDDVLTHVASQATQHERSRYWERQIYTGRVAAAAMELAPAPFLTKPPADTLVLVAYATDGKHRRWIQEHGLYNLRAYGDKGRVEVDSPALGADLLLLHFLSEPKLLLYRTGGAPQVHTAESMKRLDYPRDPGERYFCLPITEPALHLPDDLADRVREWVRYHLQSPVLETAAHWASWQEILEGRRPHRASL